MQAGYTVLEAKSGEEALLILDAHPGPVHALLTDLVMPGMSGKQLAERVREQRSKVEVLYMSGYVDEGIARHGVLRKGVTFLPKPFARRDLLASVTEALAPMRKRTAAR